MDGLLIFFVVLITAALIGLFYLYTHQSSKAPYVCNLVLSMLITFISYTSLPQNFRKEQLIVLAIGGVGILSIVPRFLGRDMLSNVMLSLSIIGGILFLLSGM